MTATTISPAPQLSPLLASLAGDASAVAARLQRSVVAVRNSHRGAGAGTVYSSDGLIVTNSHVVGKGHVEVVTADDRKLRASLLGRDREHDLAVLKVEATDLIQPTWRADPVRIGEVVIAVGHPWGQRGAVSAGIVHSTARGSGPFADAVTADVALAPGNSGGPLADSEGRVVGLNAMIAGGLAVAIPTARVLAFLDNGIAEPGEIGISGQEVVVADGGSGLILTDIEDGGPAAEAGLLPGDILASVDGHSEDVAGVVHGLREARAGRPLRLGVLRGGSPIELDVLPRVRVES
ncbi:MAG: trypsin-like peptidase domain-containing protein [Dehalococcoidia bacterium]